MRNPSTHRVQPAVPSHGIHRFFRAKDLFAKTLLPQLTSILTFELPASFDLQRFDEMQKITRLVNGLCREMKVISHEGIGLNSEKIGGSFVMKKALQPLAFLSPQKFGTTSGTAEGNKISSEPRVIDRCKTDNLACQK